MRETLLSKKIPADDRDQLAEAVMQRVTSLDSGMSNWRAARARRWQEFENDYSHRAGGSKTPEVKARERADCPDLDGIFELQNDSSKDIAAIAAFMIARAFEDLFGTSPFIKMDLLDPPEEYSAEQLQQVVSSFQNYGEERLEHSSFKTVALNALTVASVKDEAILKMTWKRDAVWTLTPKTALRNGAGKPVMDVTGAEVTDQDRLAIEPQADRELDRVYLKDEPERDLAEEGPFTWEDTAVDEEVVQFEGIDPVLISHGDFFAPLNIDSLDDADCVGHWVAMRLSEAVSKYGLSPEEEAELRNNYDDRPQSAATEPSLTRGETSTASSRDERYYDPFVKFAEVYWTGNVLMDGRRRRSFMVIDSKTRKFIHVDDLANITPQGRLPLFPLMYFQVPERWYGCGHYNKFEDDQDYCDRQQNYINWRNRYNANPTVIVVGDAFEKEDEADSEDFTLIPGRVQRMMANSGLRPEEAFHVVAMPDLDQRTDTLLEKRRANMQIRSGVTSATMGQVGTVGQNNTATGIESIMSSGQTIFSPQIGMLKEGFQSVLWHGLQLLCRFDPPQTTIEVDGVKQPLDLAQVKKIGFKVSLTMTRFHRRMEMENAMKVIDLVNSYILIPEQEKPAARVAYLQAVEAAGFEKADEIIRAAIPVVPPGAPGSAQAPVGEGAPVIPFDNSQQAPPATQIQKA